MARASQTNGGTDDYRCAIGSCVSYIYTIASLGQCLGPRRRKDKSWQRPNVNDRPAKMMPLKIAAALDERMDQLLEDGAKL